MDENVITLIQQVAERIDHRFDEVDHRFDASDNRLDRINDTLVGVQNQMAAMTKWADRFDREINTTKATQVAQQRAIDSLVDRVSRLEHKAS
jgi:archaellum component FlaC